MYIPVAIWAWAQGFLAVYLLLLVLEVMLRRFVTIPLHLVAFASVDLNVLVDHDVDKSPVRPDACQAACFEMLETRVRRDFQIFHLLSRCAYFQTVHFGHVFAFGMVSLQQTIQSFRPSQPRVMSSSFCAQMASRRCIKTSYKFVHFHNILLCAQSIH